MARLLQHIISDLVYGGLNAAHLIFKAGCLLVP